jgi:NADH dehydrogenase (ubiquinone) Fe-S protein 3
MESRGGFWFPCKFAVYLFLQRRELLEVIVVVGKGFEEVSNLVHAEFVVVQVELQGSGQTLSLLLMSLRVAGQLLARAAVARPALRRRIHSSHRAAAAPSPFTEPTSPNPTVEKYAETTSALHTYGSYLTQCLPKFIQQFSVIKDELTLYTGPSSIVPLMTFLRDHSQCQFKYLMQVTAVDFPEREKRFEVVYHLLSTSSQGRIRVKTYAGEADHVPSVTGLFRSADW